MAITLAFSSLNEAFKNLRSLMNLQFTFYIAPDIYFY